MTRSPASSKRPTLIAGGGLCGMAAALHLRRPFVLVERGPALGGLARTEERDGFYFDHTGHWLHLRDPSIEALVRGLLGDQLAAVKRQARIFSAGRLTPYPFQANLHGLDPAVVHECLLGFVRARMEAAAGNVPPPSTFEAYIEHHFGAGIARHFMIPYNTKLWGVHPREITAAWCQRFVPVPSVEQVIAGAVGAGPGELGYNVQFLYPRQGGIGTLSRALASAIAPQDAVRTQCELVAVHAGRREARLGDQTLCYHALISSIPLPALVARISDAPPAVVAAAKRLRATAVRYLNVASRRRPPADYHWVYVPEEHLPFYRVGVYSNAMPSMAPPGCGSLYVELSERGPIDLPQVLRGLVQVGALHGEDDVLFVEERVIDPAYVIFDHAYEDALQTIQSYLEKQRIFARGRYGSWIYNAMEDSLLAGRAAAQASDAMPEEVC